VVVKRMNSWGAWELERSPDVSLVSSNSNNSAQSNSFGEANTRNNNTPIKLFRREADIWFNLNHPHVVRLYGACHIGDPFFTCEYASSGSLSDYLRAHPNQEWSKLYEAALGVGYIHARDVVHGDLKCNNVVVGSDGKAKVTDFGLSALADEDTDEDDPIISVAWQWVAPECLDGARPTRESDIYSLGMCIIEAHRVVESLRLKLNESKLFPRFPWETLDNVVVKYMVTKLGRLPIRPESCDDRHWELVASMCRSSPGDRITIDAIVRQLDEFRQTPKVEPAGTVVDEASAGCNLSEVVVTERPDRRIFTHEDKKRMLELASESIQQRDRSTSNTNEWI
jgi:serine/threonine protein kinase